MPPHAPQRSASTSSPSTPLPAWLAIIAEISGYLASEAPLAAILPPVLEAVRRQLHASETSLWLPDRGEWARAATAVAERATPVDVAAVLTGGTMPGTSVAPLASGERTLGALVVRDAGGEEATSRAFLVTVANLLVPPLVAQEDARRLVASAATSTRELETFHRLTERIIDALPVGLYVVDREYRVQAWNRKREMGMQGVQREDALGRSIFDVLRRLPADLLRAELDAVFETGEMQQFETQSAASGEPRIFRMSKIPMRLDDGPVTHVITIGEDITEWTRARERVAHAQRLAAVGQLAAGAMHEINNPLATVAACAESIALHAAGAAVSDGLRERLAEYCRIIDHEVHRCKRVVEGLLDFSRPAPTQRTPTALAAVVEQTLRLLAPHSHFRRMRVDTALDGAAVIVRADADQLVQVLMALLLNAMDAMDGTGTIRVTVSRDEGARAGVLAVADAGSGIPESERARIFEPFYTTKGPGRGTGLGLAICYGIITDHEGRIEVDSTTGAGSTFRVILPLAEGA